MLRDRFVGGAMQKHLYDMDDADICRVAREELRDLIGIVKDPMWTMVTRWPLSMPQYTVGHMQQVEQIQSLAAEHEGLSLMGNAYSGVGLPDCVRSGESAAERVVERVQDRCAQKAHLHQGHTIELGQSLSWFYLFAAMTSHPGL